MRTTIKTVLAATALFASLFGNVSAEPSFPTNMSFNQAIDRSLELMKRSGYKDVSVTTQSGSVSGEFVSMTKDVLILKTKTGSIHMKSSKEKVLLSFIKLESIESISVYTLE